MKQAGAAAVEEATSPATAVVSAVEAHDVVAPDLSRDELGAVFRYLAGDVESLCRAACVSRSWCAASRNPSLWRILRFPKQPGVARRLTNDRLEWLVKRAGAALECLDLGGCCTDNSEVTLRGVVRALRAAPPLLQLGVRGLPYGLLLTKMMRYEQLRALVRPDGMLDAVGYYDIVMCQVANDAGKPCWRLCAAEDELCTQCNIYRCHDHCQRPRPDP